MRYNYRAIRLAKIKGGRWQVFVEDLEQLELSYFAGKNAQLQLCWKMMFNNS